jgi:hypothetical protein
MKTEYRDGELHLKEKPLKVVFKNEQITEKDKKKYTIIRLEIDKRC